MTIKHLIKVLKQFDENEKVFVKSHDFNDTFLTEVDACMGIDIFKEDGKGVIIDLNF